jgi:hypothetical protein
MQNYHVDNPAAISEGRHMINPTKEDNMTSEDLKLYRGIAAERDKLRELLSRAVEGPWSDADLKEARNILSK